MMMDDNGGSSVRWHWHEALQGIVPPVISPLDSAGTADAVAMAALVEHLLAVGCSGLFVLGGCGEGAWLTPSQRGAVVQAAARAVAGRVPVLAGVMLPATGPAIEAACLAASEGADAVVVGSPYYFDVDAAAQERHVEAVVTATTLPALLYNIPQCTHHLLSPETVRRLAVDRRVLGIKDSAGDFEAFQKFAAVKQDRTDFHVLQGHEALAAASLLQGADGLVPGLANVAPALFIELQDAARRGAADDCARLQQRITTLCELYRQGPWLPALKTACAALGLGNGRPAPPLQSAGVAEREAIAGILMREGLAVGVGPGRAR